MKPIGLFAINCLLLIRCHSSPINSILSHHQSITPQNAGADIETTVDKLPQIFNNTEPTNTELQSNSDDKKEIRNATFRQSDASLETKDAIVIDLEKIYKMSFMEYVGRQMKSLWYYMIHGSKEEPKSDFLARCVGIAKKIRQLIPIVMIGGGIIVTKLAFLVLFSLKTIGLVGLLLLLNVATVAAKLGAYLASKKADHHPQNLHVHVQPWNSDEHIDYSHLKDIKGPPYGWDNRADDIDAESHELYNLYEKLKFENNLRRYFRSIKRSKVTK